MKALEEVLSSLQADVSRLTDEHQEACRAVEDAKHKSAALWNRLCAATNLLGALSGYKQDWLTEEGKP